MVGISSQYAGAFERDGVVLKGFETLKPGEPLCNSPGWEKIREGVEA
jgi:hypothetical protein